VKTVTEINLQIVMAVTQSFAKCDGGHKKAARIGADERPIPCDGKPALEHDPEKWEPVFGIMLKQNVRGAQRFYKQIAL